MKIREILEDSLLIVRFFVYSCRDCLDFLISELDCSKKQSKIKMAMLIANIPVRDLHVKCKEFDNPRLYRVDSLSFDFDYSLTPYVFKHKELYYMAYSGNSFESPFYGVGCATATDIMGEWTKYDENPILQNPGTLQGVGHSAMFKDKEGKLRIVYHAHKDKEHIHPRGMYIGSVSFQKVNGVDRMRISKDYITAELVK